MSEKLNAVCNGLDMASLHHEQFRDIDNIFTALVTLLAMPETIANKRSREKAIAGLITTGSNMSELYAEKCVGDVETWQVWLDRLNKVKP